jgi:hypothetical protein
MPFLSDSCRMIGSPASVKAAAQKEKMGFPLSLRQFISAPGCPYLKCITIHLKVLTNPNVRLSTSLLVMRQVYDTAFLGVRVASRESLASISDFSLLNVVDVGACKDKVTGEQAELFTNRNNVAFRDIVVYFVLLTNPTNNGCAVHPTNRDGAVVASIASKWTLAHEIGHLLGLKHVGNNTRLMTGNGTNKIVGVPTLTQAEISTMQSSNLVRNC